MNAKAIYKMNSTSTYQEQQKEIFYKAISKEWQGTG